MLHFWVRLIVKKRSIVGKALPKLVLFPVQIWLAGASGYVWASGMFKLRRSQNQTHAILRNPIMPQDSRIIL